MKIPRQVSKRLRESGRIHPFLLGIIVLVAGLLAHQWWWQIGAVIIVAVFVDAYFWYRTLD
jgi:hypothetical protein